MVWARRFGGRQDNTAAGHRGRHGQGLVELALVLPMLLLMVTGVFELGRLIHATVCVSHAARDGARLAMDMTVDQSQVYQRVIDSARPLTITNGDVDISGRVPGNDVSVTVTYGFTSPVPFINQFWGGDEFVIHRTRVARVHEA